MPDTTAVREVMTRDVVTLRPDQPVHEAADVLAGKSIGAAPVVDAGGKLVGLLRDEDLIVSEARLHVPTVISFLGADLVLPSSLHRFEHELKKAAGATVADVMITDYHVAKPDDTLDSVAAEMHDRDVTHVPVVDGGKLVGIVARGDLVRFLSRTS
ncbi:MAG TPA: CBS domain-containing protein [Acidimicrobiia bacterium]|nr:CBS domain-containing protein [Acidimicrobiia bacterium]